MPRKRNSESGQFEEVYSDDRVLKLLEDTRLGTSEVADQLNCHRSTAHKKLRELEQRDLVTSTQVGNTLMWEIPNK